MSDEDYQVNGVEFTETEVLALADHLKRPEQALWDKIMEAERTATAEAAMGNNDITDRQLWEARGAYQELVRIAGLVAGVPGLAAEIREAAKNAAAQ